MNKTGVAAIAIVIVVAAAVALLSLAPSRQTATTTLPTTALLNTSTTIFNNSSASGTHPSNQTNASQYSRLFVGQATSYRNFTISLSEITVESGKEVAILNISTNFNFSRAIGERQYSNIGAFYLSVNQINSTGDWAAVGESEAIPTNFTNSTYASYSQSSAGNPGNLPSYLPACNAGNSAFSVSPIQYNDISSIRPLGSVNSHIDPTDHVYFSLQTAGGVPVKAPLISPGNLTIYQMAGASYTTSTGAKYNDYTLYFASCKSVAGFFAHIYTVSNKLLNSFTPPYKSCLNYTEVINGWGLTSINYCIKDVNISTSTGEVLGSAGGVAGGSEAMDFQMLNYSQTPLYFVNQTRNQGELYVACPLDYFTSSIKSTLYNYLGESTNGGLERRTAQPLCGTIAQDINNTAQGDWANPSRANATFPDAGTIALIHDAVNPSTLTFSLGGGAVPGLPNDIWFTFSTYSSGYTNRAFSNVTADGDIYCYQSLQNEYGNSNPSGVMLLQLMNSSTLSIEYQSAGSCSNPSFTRNRVYFYR